MKCKAYESDPLQISMERSKYIQGTRDYLPVNSKFSDYVPVKNVLEFALDDTDPRTKVEVGGGKRINYIPAKNLVMPVDKKQVIANNVVSHKDTARILSELKFSIPGSYVIKNELAVLSLLSNNDWTRPIYYTSPDVKEAMGLKNHYRNEGFASRLVPLTNNNGNSTYYIDTDIMYDNLMNKYTWGRMEADDVYLDEFCIRTIRIVGVREMFNQLAVMLISENKIDSAVKVLDRCQQILPVKKIPQDYYTIQTAEFYYLAKQIDKANKILEEYAGELLDELDYFNSLDANRKAMVDDNQNRSFSLLNLLIDKAQRNNQKDLVDKINNKKKAIFGDAELAR